MSLRLINYLVVTPKNNHPSNNFHEQYTDNISQPELSTEDFKTYRRR